MFKVVILFLLSLIGRIEVNADNTTEKISAINYLTQFGYANESTMSVCEERTFCNEASLRSALTEFQKFNHLPITGTMNEATAELMKRPRCGVPDPVNKRRDHPYSEPYTLFGRPWDHRNLTYRFTKYSSYRRDLNFYETEEEIERALNEWAKVSNLTFTKSNSGNADIEFRFEEGSHGTRACSPFDGPGLVLAHAFAPGDGIGGDVHFDDAETWTKNTPQGKNLFAVALHELGHSLGLGHSNVRGTVMYAYSQPYDPNYKLTEDDIEGIRILYPGDYGSYETEKIPQSTLPPRRSPITRPTYAPPQGRNRPLPIPRRSPPICQDPSMDAVLPLSLNELIFFKGDDYYRIKNHAIEPGYPYKISMKWPGLETPIDAALNIPSRGYQFFFKGNQYWRYSNYRLDNGYPKLISRGWRSVPNDLDAALLYAEGVIWFFKDDYYYEYIDRGRITNSTCTKKTFSSVKLPVDKIDAAFNVRNRTAYFFYGDRFYWWTQNQAFSNLPYSSTKQYWLGCRS